MLPIYDVTILGTGPAGLAAAQRLRNTHLKVLVLDAGKAVDKRNRYCPHDATTGDGGAGLFSDGKFSFFPSATALWTLPRSADLRAAYEWTCETLSARGLSTPPFPNCPDQYTPKIGTEDWFLKSYPSDYLSLEARLELVADMISKVKGTIINEQRVHDIAYSTLQDKFKLHTFNVVSGEATTFTTKRLIIGTGRFGPLEPALKALTGHSSFHRLEVGFRIEQSSNRAFFKDMKLLDPKLRLKINDGSVEWRTFCVCREGEAVMTETNGLWTVSGRSDCPATGRSNSGFNTRVLEGSKAAESVRKVVQSMSKQSAYFEVPMIDLLEEEEQATELLDGIYGSDLRKAMATGLGHLANVFSDLREDRNAKLIGPTLEGVGWYPTVDEDLKLLDVPASIVGDACGLFRGIVAAMISGHYGASAILDDF
jgi:uncharacterized protein